MMWRTGVFAIACCAVSAWPAAAETETHAPGSADLVAADPLVTSSATGTTTYFGNANTTLTTNPASPNPSDATAAKPEKQPEPQPTVIAKVNLASQQMVVSVNGVQRYVWPVSSGVSRYPTPTGTFRPAWTSKMWYSRQYDWAPMPSAVFINGGVAVHGTYHTGALGSPASHGCIRLSTTNARTFYNLVERQGLNRVRVIVFGRPNWRDQVAVGRGGKRQKVYAQKQDGWFGGGSTNSDGSAGTSRAKGRSTYVVVDGVPRKVYRRKNGDLVFADSPRRKSAYKTYGYGYGSDF